MFANDLFILGKANVEVHHRSCYHKGIYKEFHLFSGLHPNLSKSSIVFAAVSEDVRLNFIYFGYSRSTTSFEVSRGAIDCF